MPFIPTLPSFNLLGRYWGPPNIFDVPFQLYLSTKGVVEAVPGQRQFYSPSIYVRLPISFRGLAAPPWVGKQFSYFDQEGQEWFYIVRWWDYAHAGFPNEYIAWLVEQADEFQNRPDPDR